VKAIMENLLKVLGRRLKHSKGSIKNSMILVIVYGFEESIRNNCSGKRPIFMDNNFLGLLHGDVRWSHLT